MASRVYNKGLAYILSKFLAGSAALKVALLMTNTTADTENSGKVFVGDFTTLDRFDGSGYTDKALASGAATQDDANTRGDLDFADVTWSALPAGTRSIQGVLLYDFITNDAASPIVAWLEFSSNKTPDGSDFVLSINDLLRAVSG